MSHHIRVLLADDKVLFLESIKIVIETVSNGDIQVVGIVRNGKEAVEFLQETVPDIILMDVRMPVMDGVQAVKNIMKRYPDVKIIMLTTFSDDHYVKKAMQYGAVGYILKDIPPDELISFIRTVDKGSVLLAPEVAKKLFQKQLSETAGSHSDGMERRKQKMKFQEELSHREAEIYEQLKKGMSNKEIAERLFIAEQTVKNHIARIYSKLGYHNRYDVFKDLDDDGSLEEG